jgi:hypothetical protein
LKLKEVDELRALIARLGSQTAPGTAKKKQRVPA